MKIISNIVNWVATPYTLYQILRDPAISRAVKLRSGIGLAILFVYVISPFDIVPDFIPMAGWLDDLIIVPVGIGLLRKITPGIDVMEKRKRAENSVKRILVWTILSLAAAILVGLAWVGLVVWMIVRLVGG